MYNRYANRSAVRARATAAFAAHKAVTTLCAGAFAAPVKPDLNVTPKMLEAMRLIVVSGKRQSIRSRVDAAFSTCQRLVKLGFIVEVDSEPQPSMRDVDVIYAFTPAGEAYWNEHGPIHSDTDWTCDLPIFDLYVPKAAEKPDIVKAAEKLPRKAKVNSWGMPDQRIANRTRALLGGL